MSTFRKADILIPNGNIDLTKWSVVACDQYTSQPEYWDSVSNIVGNAPSSLNVVFPEVFLSEGEARIEKINKNMEKYLKEGIFTGLPSCLIYVERTQSNGKIRRGIIGAVDLEDYDFNKDSQSKIRATEGTVLERIPPRVKIRENAPLELPHIMLLMDDADNTVIESCEKGDKLYDFELMQSGGHLTGYLIPDASADKVLSAIDALDKSSRENLLFAVGDGNHSLATAKTCWENIKNTLTEDERKNHPARFCLVEIENIHDFALEFEPIHRVLFDVSPNEIISDIMHYYTETSKSDNGGQHIEYIFGGKRGDLYIKNSGSALAVGTLQKYIDEKGYKVDYIHGADVVQKLAQKPGTIGFLLPAMQKSELFKAVISDGALPRKTFSMGEAQDKRFYLEAKKIK